MKALKVKILRKDLLSALPTYATAGSAGLDLVAAIDEPVTLAPNETALIPSGIAIYLEDPSVAALLLPRSGLGHKKGIVLGNLVGLIDSDYQGEVKISLWNRSKEPYTVKPLERVAQMIIVPVERPTFEVVENFEVSKRADGGFGSTGK
ncbi:MAG TPA: dUTP diphosphatase [Sutterella sp.]|nr:dUTP diphosphatase [Sutterella sp.]